MLPDSIMSCTCADWVFDSDLTFSPLSLISKRIRHKSSVQTQNASVMCFGRSACVCVCDGACVTFMLPSAEPVTKKSSKASSARALMAESWAWKVWSSCLWRMSNTHTKPFLPPVISSCCLGAYCSTVAPFSWQGNAE